jgi:putative nucleotidyltransferase with HDIG domain
MRISTSAEIVSREQASVLVLMEVLSERRQGIVHDYVRVAQLAEAVALRLGLSEYEASRVELAGRLHDIGKVAIPDAILEKPGALTDAEWYVMHRHPEIGARIIAADQSLEDVAMLVRSHHERYDGRGYPDRLDGERIPFGACIIAVCSAFVAMMRKRSYIDGITVVEALAELQRCSGSQFHPAVVEVMESVFHDLFE